MSLTLDPLFQDSVIVTGTHYSMSTLMGSILGVSDTFHVVHEPLNYQPTLGYATVPTQSWYHYFGADETPELAQNLEAFQFGRGAVRGALNRLPKIRSPKDVGRVGKFLKTGLTHAKTPKRAVFKDPFLCFSACHLQEQFGLYTVLTLRHPCGFAESLNRRGRGFDFADLLQPALLEALPDLADDLDRFAHEPQPIVDQAALLWKTVYGFAARYSLHHPRTHIVRQEDLAADPIPEVRRIFTALEATWSPAVDAFLEESLNAKAPADFAAKGSSYVHRNARETAAKWKSRMTPEEIRTVLDRTGEVATQFGYEAEATAPAPTVKEAPTP